MSGGSSSPSPTTTTTGLAALPDWAQGYAKDAISNAASLTNINTNPYQQYDAQRIADFSPMQQQAQQGAANMQTSGAIGVGQDMAQAAGLSALGTGYNASNYNSQFNPQGIGYGAQNMQGYQMGPAERVQTQSFAQPGAADAYMSPYMQNVVDIQKREAQRQSGIQGTQQQAQAVGAGAFGGSRDAIQRAERERNLGQQMGDIQAQGSQIAYQQAQQQFNAEQQARLAAQQANQQAGLTTGIQNLGAAQQTGLANQAAQNQAGQFNAGQNLQAAGLGAQYGQAANQLNEQSRQYGAGLGLQGLQTGLQAAGQLGSLGQNEYAQNMGINQLQGQYGAQQQAQQQQGLTQSYQDFLNQQNYPYKQMGFMSDMLRGLPLGQQTTQSIYQAPPSAIQNIGALGLGAYGAKQLGMFAEGGEVESYADGGDINSMDDPNAMTAAVAKLSDEQLQQIIQRPSSAAELQAAKLELATRASEKSGLAGAYNMAQGGMVAFARGGIPRYDGEEDSLVDEGGGEEDGLPALNTGVQTVGNKAANDAITPALATVAQRVASPNDFVPTADPKAALKSSMATVSDLAGTSPYAEQKQNMTELVAQSKDALEQGKGLAALQAMGALLQGPDFMRALGGAGAAFANTYGQALAAKKQSDMSIAQMNISIANGQRAENLGLAKDAIGSYQAAEKLRLDAWKAKQEQDAKTLKALAYADKATQPPKPAAIPKESDMVIFSKASPAEQEQMIKYFKNKGDTQMAAALAAIAGRADVAGGQQSIDAVGKMAQLRKQAAAEIDNEEFTNRETRTRYKADPAQRQKDIDARVESLVESAKKLSPGKASGTGTRLKFDANGNQIQ